MPHRLRSAGTALPPRRALAAALAALLLLAAAGCAPKRVVRGELADGPPLPETRRGGETRAVSPPRETPLTLIDMPDPEPRGQSGERLPARRPAAGDLGVGLAAATLAREQIGKPYQWGASGPDRFDCSGLVQHIFGELGVDLPRVSRDQAACGSPVPKSELQAGDLVFFSINGGDIDHVGIYVGGNDFIHAPRRYVPVGTESLDNSWWRRRFRAARRLP